MLNLKKLSKKILKKQWFPKEEITKQMIEKLAETLRSYYTIHITEELEPKNRATYIYLLNNSDITEISDFLTKNINNYDQFIADLTYQLEDEMWVENLTENL